MYHTAIPIDGRVLSLYSPRSAARPHPRPGPQRWIPGGSALVHPACRPSGQGRCLALAWLVAALLAAAALLAPEQPSAQAAICQRHNGLAACRVW